jgi:hypothetical protein
VLCRIQRLEDVWDPNTLVVLDTRHTETPQQEQPNLDSQDTHSLKGTLALLMLREEALKEEDHVKEEFLNRKEGSRHSRSRSPLEDREQRAPHCTEGQEDIRHDSSMQHKDHMALGRKGRDLYEKKEHHMSEAEQQICFLQTM